MPFLKAVAKAFVALVLLGGLLIFAAANFGYVDARYRCEGETNRQDNKSRQTLYLKVRLYRAWMFWFDGGMVWTELPNQVVDLYLKVEEIGDFIRFRSDDGKETGQLSTLSNAIALIYRDGSSFTGACTHVAPDA